MNQKFLLITLAIFLGLTAAAYGIASAQRNTASGAAQQSAQPSSMGRGMQGGMMGMGMMSQGKMGGMGQGMMGMQSGMMDFCPMMTPGAKVEVKSIEHGATITITGEDAKSARRIQLMAEMMRLMHELRNQQ